MEQKKRDTQQVLTLDMILTLTTVTYELLLLLLLKVITPKLCEEFSFNYEFTQR